MVALSEELLRDAPQASEAVITRELRAAIGLALDNAVMADITSGVTPRTAAASPLDDARSLLLDIDVYENSRLFWVAGTIAAAMLATDHDAGVRSAPDVSPVAQGTFLNLPVFVTQAPAAASLLVLVDGARHAAALEDVEVSFSNQALVHADDAPTAGVGGSPASLTSLGTANLISLWQENASGIRALQYFGFARLRGGSAASVSYAGSP
jgi:hypothetical protein